MLTADPAAPNSRHSRKGIVKMPRRFEETVSSSASAVLPPTVCISQAGDWFWQLCKRHLPTMLPPSSRLALPLEPGGWRTKKKGVGVGGGGASAAVLWPLHDARHTV